MDFPQRISREDMEIRVGEWLLAGARIRGIDWDDGRHNIYFCPDEIDVHRLLCCEEINIELGAYAHYFWDYGVWTRRVRELP